MKKSNNLIKSTLLILILLLSGCAERGNSYAPGTEINSSLDFSGSDISDSASTLNSSSETESSNISSSSEGSSVQSPDVSVNPVPVEFTEEDKEVQEILMGMESIFSTTNNWAAMGKPDDDNAKRLFFLFPEFKSPNAIGYHNDIYYELPDNYSECGMVIPKTYNDFNDLLLGFLSEQYVENKSPVTKGSMTEITGGSFKALDEQTDGALSLYSEHANGVFSVVIDNQFDVPKYIEIDGKMYRSGGEGVRGLDGLQGVNPDTVKVISRTDDTIEFTFLTAHWTSFDEDGNPLYLDDAELYAKHAIVGVLRYERGGWRRDWDKAAKERWDEWQEKLREQNGIAE